MNNTKIEDDYNLLQKCIEWMILDVKIINHMYECCELYSICDSIHVCEICGMSLETIKYTPIPGLTFTSDIFHKYTKHNIIMNSDVKNMIMANSLSSLIGQLKLKHQRIQKNHVFDHAHLIDYMHR